MQYRAAQAGNTVKVAQPAGTVPAFLRVTRTGTTLSASTSSDGVTWTVIAGSTVTLNLGATILEGMAVTSHNGGAMCTVTMDSVTPG